MFFTLGSYKNVIDTLLFLGELFKKAKYFYKMIMKKDYIRASDGWLHKFKRQFGICFLIITGEKLSCDVSAVDPFVRKKKLGLGPEQMYKADESSLFSRLLPTKIFIHRAEESAARRIMSKDRITFMPCSNASGTHKFEMLVIGKVPKPRAFQNQSHSVTYRSQSRGWVTREVFTEWFHKVLSHQ
jgi:hypothetical protein